MIKYLFIFLMAITPLSKAQLHIPENDLKLSKKDEVILEKIEKSLNDIKNLKADIHQETKDYRGRNRTQKGYIYIQRLPKKFGLKLYYKPPQEMIVVGMNGSVMYNDINNAQKGFLDLKSTNAAFLMNEKITFKDTFRLIGFREIKDKYSIRVVQKANPLGYLDLVFSKDTYTLLGWTIYEPQGNQINVMLKNINLKAKFDRDTFKFWNPQVGTRPKL